MTSEPIGRKLLLINLWIMSETACFTKKAALRQPFIINEINHSLPLNQQFLGEYASIAGTYLNNI